MTYTHGPLSIEAGGTVGVSRLVKLSSGKIVHNTAAATDDPVGVTRFSGISGDIVTVFPLATVGTLEMTAAGTITNGAEVYAAADGKVSALPAEAATYRKIGIAMEAATGDGQIIEVLPYDYHATTVVS